MKIKRVPIASLVEDPGNVRIHPERNIETVIPSLQRFGQAEPLVVQAGTHRIIGGHGRLAAMKKIGWHECDIVELEIDDAKATALAVALNRTAELAEWNMPELSKLLQEINGKDDLLAGLGFDADEIDDILSSVLNNGGVRELTEDEIPGQPDAATTQRGDVWHLCASPRSVAHTLCCGDSSDPVDVHERLLGGRRIHLVNMDPPYNVKVEPRSNNAIAAGLSSFSGATHHQKLDVVRHPEKMKKTHKKLRAKDRPLANDFIKPEDFERMLLAWFGNASDALEDGRGFYIWGGYANCANYPAALVAAKLYFSQAIIWVKEHPVLTRKDFMGNHEWCFYGWKEGAAHEFFGPNNAPDVWNVKKLNHTAMVHLTEKPVELASRAIQYSSRKGENVLDLFGGSGSTLMACEQLERNAFLMELDPLYCDVIIERWQNHTKKSAMLGGSTFEQVREERIGAMPAKETT